MVLLVLRDCQVQQEIMEHLDLLEELVLLVLQAVLDQLVL